MVVVAVGFMVGIRVGLREVWVGDPGIRVENLRLGLKLEMTG